MKHSLANRLVLTSLLIVLLLAQPLTVLAQRGAPGSSEFAFGAVVYPEGPYLKDAMAAAVDLGLDWLSVPVSWELYQPDADATPRIERLEPVMRLAVQRELPLMISITGAPAWAVGETGPDPLLTVRFVTALLQQYPEAIRAIELFPAANTRQGWRAAPSPAAYTALLSAVQESLSQQGGGVLLVAAGLRPLANPAPAGEMSDLDFLRGLYQQGAAALMPVVSIDYSELTGSPLDFPAPEEPRVFRRYELIRQLMVENHHQNGSIWITHFHTPSGKIKEQDTAYQSPSAQSEWMSQAYVQLRGQLYIRVGCLPGLNPEPEEATEKVPSLLYGAGRQHPFYRLLREMVALNKAGSPTLRPGKSKEGYFDKNRP